MTDFTKRQKDILELCTRITNADKPSEAVEKYISIMETISYQEVIWVVDEMVKQEIPMQELKKGINKYLNLFYNSLNNAKLETPPRESFLGYLIQNNQELDTILKSIKPFLRDLNRDPERDDIKTELIKNLKKLLLFDKHYIIKENILFPLLEKKWENFRCLQVMWSFHDDIRRNIKKIIQLLNNPTLDIEEFNSVIGSIFFDMYAIKFREEKILYPFAQETITEEELNQMLKESLEFDWPYIKPEIKIDQTEKKKNDMQNGLIDLLSGELMPEQIQLIFNHLPVDITFVDENNQVRYFSTPKKRIFPRSKAIIGREVNNCHPPESVHVVEKIVNSFRNGEKDEASFWIEMGDEYILIQYFAVRDADGNYKGVLEVSQEITNIKKLEGEKRLLDWE